MKGVEPIEVGLDRGPVVVDVGAAVEAGVHVDERLEIAGIGDRRVRQTVDPDHLGRDALPDLGGVERVGEDREARMAVEVDEPRADHEPGGVDPLSGRHAGGLAEHDLEAIAAHTDRGRERLVPRAVDDDAVLDQQVERRGHRPTTSAGARRGCPPGRPCSTTSRAGRPPSVW